MLNLISYMSLEAVILANAGIQLVTLTRSVISGAVRGLRAGFPPAANDDDKSVYRRHVTNQDAE